MSTDTPGGATCSRAPGNYEFPFRLARPLRAEEKHALERIALGANDRYVGEFLEAHGFCPYAKAGRERGATARHVLFVETRSLAPLAAIFSEAARGSIEVVQVIFPLVEVAADEFARFANDATEHLNAALERPVFASAALHPELPYRTHTPNSLIPLFRRTPDPTLQWVRLTTLDGIYAGRRAGTAFVDVHELGAFLSEPATRDLYQQIARANQATALRLGVEEVQGLLARMREDVLMRYRQVLAGADGTG
jgi:hypothetical protein